MPTVKLTYTIGGDDFTDDDKLYFKIYNDGVLYHTTGSSIDDDDVSVSVGIAIISNINVSDGIDYNFTISEVDEQNLESLISNTVSISIEDPQPTESIIIETDSDSETWTPQEVLNTGTDITWDVNGGQVQVISGNNVPTFDLSAVSTPIITGKSTSNFVGLTSLQLDQLDCTSIDITKATELIKIDAYLNSIGTIDLTNNLDLEFIWLQDTSLTAFDLSLNIKAKSIYLDYSNLLSSTILDKIINDLDTNGVENGTLNIDTNTGSLTSAAQPSYDNLVTKGWSIDVPSPTVTPPSGGDNPIIYNFRVDNINSNRVYFSSSKELTASNTTGFSVTDKIISSITINAGATTGHYFTVSVAFDHYSNNTIRYAGGSNMIDSSLNPLIKFDLQYIINGLSEPLNSGDEYYIKVTGDDARDGLSELTAWKTVSYGVSQLRAGDTLWIEAGDYGDDRARLDFDGAINNPIKILGYKNLIGDSPSLTMSPTTSFDSSEMPYIHSTSTSNSGFSLGGHNYIIVKNIQVEGYNDTIDFGGQSQYCVLDNVYAKDSQDYSIKAFYTSMVQCRVVNSFIGKSESHGIRMAGNRNLLESCHVSSTDGIHQDYFVSIYAGATGLGESIIRNIEIIRDQTSTHWGHGVSLRQGGVGRFVYNTLVENIYIEAVGSAALEARSPDVRYCVFRNIEIDNKNLTSGTFNAVRITSARNNIFDKVAAYDCETFVRFLGSDEEQSQIDALDAGNYNTFKNCKMYNNPNANSNWFIVLEDSDSTAQDRVPNNNKFINCTFHNISYAVGNSTANKGQGNEFINCIFSDINSRNYTNTDDWEFSYSDFYSSFTTPSGTGNISLDPQFVDLVDFVPQNVLLKDGVANLGYDYNDLQREDPPTIGLIEI